MKRGITRTISLTLLASAFAFLGCEKVAPTELEPRVTPSSQYSSLSGSTGKETPGQAAWRQFVERVERGEIQDPAGQYVAKSTIAAAATTGNPVGRPKYDVWLRDASRGFALRPPRPSASTATSGIDEPCVVQNYDPCAPCYEGPSGCGGGGSTPSVYSTFESSETQGGTGFIHDLKLVANTGYTLPDNETPQPGYTKLNADLNKGAAGKYIYFTFTRNSADIKYYGPIGSTYAYGPLTFFSVVTRPYLYQTGVPWPTDHAPVWFINYNRAGAVYYTEELDLNKGCGWVDMVYAHQSKNPAFGSPVQEVGVISGNSSSIQPPAGWQKVGVDLNKEAGGDYIYLCFKR